ncbi:hypothetical protein MKL26_04485 [Streptococcus suis]|nr:hypothetical protein [Streptococcus suis]
MGKRWTRTEIDYLYNKHDRMALKNIARNLGRSVNAVRSKMQRLGLTTASDSEYISLSEFRSYTGVTRAQSHYWIHAKKFPARRIGKEMKLKVSSFWEWAENNKHLIDWESFPKYTFLPEPNWFFSQKDLINRRKFWTVHEERRLAKLISYGYTYDELVCELKRSKSSIRRKIYDLYLPKPKRANRKELT